MNKTFNPKEIEHKIYQNWEEAGYFKPSGTGKPYCIAIPPPNVTGSLHMGHGFQYSIMDALIRYHRMLGDNTLWQVGTDHAGIATQLLVEQQLKQEGKKRQDFEREEFLKRIWAWKDISRNSITQQMRRLGISVDWDREKFTLDEELCIAVKNVFISLYKEGLIYRGKRLANWDPVLLTAVSDLEVNFVEKDGSLWHIRYPFAEGEGEIVIATTRPETMLGDVAIAVNPEDERYKRLIGQNVKLPLTDRTIPIIADEYVDKEFGTGCVKITPAHDFNDYEVGKRHNLPQINIFTQDAFLNENVPTKYQGLERFEARKKIVADLESADLLFKIEPYKNKVPTGDRSGAILEPYLTDQWFVRTKPLAKRALEAFEKGEPEFVPENWSKTYRQWLENIEDWCVSRQLWWGHRVPAWYDENGKEYVGMDELSIRAENNLPSTVILHQDEDVLDTWFSSALWPFSSLGWQNKKDIKDQPIDLQTFYPTSVLVTGFDIIFFWVARMTMIGLHFTDRMPFEKVYVTGLIRDSKGQKMSKSKGNVLDPLDLVDGISLEDLIKKRTSNLMLSSQIKTIEKATRDEFPEGIPSSGTDALRFTFCSLATMSRDINFDIKRLEGNRNFCTKLWNAARFVLMNMEGLDSLAFNGEIKYSLADKWIRSKLKILVKDIKQFFDKYRFDLITQHLYKFIWNDYCDRYLEFCKSTLRGLKGKAEQQGARTTLLEVLEIILRLIHPIMPFITEEIWQQISPFFGKTNETIMLQKYPEESDANSNLSDIEQLWLERMEIVEEIITKVLSVRGELNIPFATKIKLLSKKTKQIDIGRSLTFLNVNSDYAQRADSVLLTDEYVELYLKTLAGIDEIKFLEDGEIIPPSAPVAIAEKSLDLYIPLEGDILEKERFRLQKELAKIEKDYATLKTRLDNPNFSKAPEVVQEKTKIDFSNKEVELQKLKEQLGIIL